MPIINQVVAGSGGGSFIGIQKAIDANGKLVNSSQVIDLTGVTDMEKNALYYAYSSNTNIPSGTTFTNPAQMISGDYAMMNCFYGTNLQKLLCPNLVRITGSGVFSSCLNSCEELDEIAFPKLEFIGSHYGSSLKSICSRGNQYGTFYLTSVSFPKLKTIRTDSGGTAECQQAFFYQCALASVELPELEEVNGSSACEQMFYHTALVTIRFPSLKVLQGSKAFGQIVGMNSTLQSVWFYALDTDSFGSTTNQFNKMLSGDTGCTVHFPIRIQSTIGSWADVTAGFGGTNTTVLFDIVTSLTGADGNTYTRSEKDSTSTATAWTYNDTLYYTSGVSNNDAGVNEPSVSDAIYSDAACTQALTTIAAIA